MLLLILGMLLAIALLALPFVILSLVRKGGIKVLKPFLLGLGIMIVGSVLPVAYAWLVEEAAGLGENAAPFFTGIGATVLSWPLMGIAVAGTMSLALRFLLPGRRSAPEALVLGAGVCIPTLFYRGFVIVLAYLNGISAGAGYGESAAVLFSFSWLLLSAVVEAPLAIITAYFVNEKKSWLGFALCAGLETICLSASSMAETLGIYDWIMTAVNILAVAGAVWAAIKLWPHLPAPVTAKSKIQWPDGEDDGHIR